MRSRANNADIKQNRERIIPKSTLTNSIKPHSTKGDETRIRAKRTPEISANKLVTLDKSSLTIPSNAAA